ncbi:innexin family member shaking B isoform X3 [Colletes latitarsis]|uniref:innexin family member shaking B isoform X3 n=1 Tax=Colletes latitarsis TaxID=2605962 RepID=UPI004035ACD8
MPLMLKMIDVFGSLRSLFKVQRISEDTLIFRLHYRATVALLLGGCVTLACKSISGSPIHCEASGSVDKIVLETFCWLHTTYSMVHAFNKSLGQAVPYPGVSNSKGDGMHGHAAHPLVKQHKYYQGSRAAYCLSKSGDPFLHTPMAVERLGRWENSRADDGPRHRSLLRGREEAEEKDAARLFVGESSLSQLVGLQVLPLRSSRPGQCGRFLESDQEDRVDPMIYVFPRMTKCTFYKYGVSGEVERHDAVCILPLNVVNEKIYVFLWFWFLFLGVLSFITVLYRIVIIFSPRTRVYLLRLRFRLVRKEAVETIVRRSKVGDWFLLYMLGENLDTVIYRDVMHELANKLASRHHHSVPGIKGELQEA